MNLSNLNPLYAGKAITSAAIAVLTALVVAPDFGVRNILTAAVAGLVSLGAVFSVPNKAAVTVVEPVIPADPGVPPNVSVDPTTGVVTPESTPPAV